MIPSANTRTHALRHAGLAVALVGLAACGGRGCRGGGGARPPAVVDDTFDDFSKGTLFEAGAKIYVAAAGELRLVDQPDVNGDGYSDLVVSNAFNGSFAELFDQVEWRPKTTCKINSYIYWGGKDGVRADRRSELPTTCTFGNSVADIDADGYPDIVFSNHKNAAGAELNSYIYWGSKQGFSPERRSELPTVGAAANTVADVDRDGFLDIVFSNNHDNSYIYWGSSDGFSVRRRAEVPTIGAMGNTVADLNKDGFLDLVFCNFPNTGSPRRNSYVYWGSPDGFSLDRRTELPTNGAYDVSSADLNGDSYPDLVFTNSGDGAAVPSYIYWGGKDGFSPERRTELPSLAAHCTDIADIDADGHLDVFIANVEDGKRNFGVPSYIYWGGKDGFSPERRTELPSRVNIGSRIIDLNFDGRLDVVVLHLTHGGKSFYSKSRVYWNTGGRTFGDEPTELPTVGAHLSTTTDLGATGDRRFEQQFTSRPLDSGRGAPEFGELRWKASVPAEGALAFVLRSADTAEALAAAPWVGPKGPKSRFVPPAGEGDGKATIGAALPRKRFVQYRAFLRTYVGPRAVSPVLRRVEITLR